MNENCSFCQCFTELHFFYRLLVVSCNFNRFAVCFQSFINIACRSTQNAARIKRFLRPRPHVSGDFCIRKFFYADTPSVHTCPPYTLGVSGDFCIRSPEWKFLYTLCIRIRVDARIRIFLYTLTSQYQNQSFSARDFPKWRRAETLCVQCY